MKPFIALIILFAASLHSHAQGIVYSSYGTGLWVGHPRSFAPIAEFSMDLNGDGVNDFRFVGQNPAGGGFYLEPQNQNGVLGYPDSELRVSFLVRRHLAGDDISAGATATGLEWVGYQPNPNSSLTGPYLLFNLFFGGGGGGEFATRQPGQNVTGHVGVQFYAADGLHYGWIRVRGGEYNDGRILDYAYNTEPGQSIAAGAVPEPSTWALLGLGLAALCLLRKRSAA